MNERWRSSFRLCPFLADPYLAKNIRPRISISSEGRDEDVWYSMYVMDVLYQSVLVLPWVETFVRRVLNPTYGFLMDVSFGFR